MAKYTKEQALKVVVACAKQYRENLANKNLLFICQDKYKRVSTIEFSFDATNFLHLTGLKVKKPKYNANDMDSADNPDDTISAKEFYEKCLEHRLSTTDFEFAKDGTTPLKLDVLPRLISKDLSATMIGDYNSRNPKLVTDKLAGNIVACMGFVPTGPTGRYVPNTVLKADIRDYIGSFLRVIAVFRKPMDAELYTELTYAAKNIQWESIDFPARYEYLPKPASQSKNACEPATV